MPRDDAVTLLAANLANLPGPDDTLLKLPFFSTFNQSDEDIIADITARNHIIALGIITFLENNGYQLRHHNDPKADAATKPATVNCANCGYMLIALNLDDDLHTNIAGTEFIHAIGNLATACPHG